MQGSVVEETCDSLGHEGGVLPVHAPVEALVVGVLEAEPLHPHRGHVGQLQDDVQLGHHLQILQIC